MMTDVPQHTWQRTDRERIIPIVDGRPISYDVYDCTCGEWETTAPPGDSGGPPAGFLQHLYDVQRQKPVRRTTNDDNDERMIDGEIVTNVRRESERHESKLHDVRNDGYTQPGTQ